MPEKVEQTALYMTVLKVNPDDTHSLEQINLYDVDFIETDKRKIIYHIGENTYYQINNKSELNDFLINKGFDPLDRPNLVNLNKIRKFDEEHGKVYFVEHPNANSKFATVARIKYQLLKNVIHKIVGNNNDTAHELKLDTSKQNKSMWKGLFGRR